MAALLAGDQSHPGNDLAVAMRRIWEALGRKARGAKWSDEGLDEEMAFHIEMETSRNRSLGLSASEARRKAMLDFGNPVRAREACRREKGWSWLGDLWLDFVYGLRVLRRRKGLAGSAIVTLGLCLGGCAAFFAAMNSFVLEALPFDEPGRLVEVSRQERGAKTGMNRALYNAFRDQEDIFSDLSYFEGRWSNLQVGESAFRGQGLSVTPGFFRLLGKAPIWGEQAITAESEGDAWLAESLWRSAFGADRSILGSTILVDGNRYRLAGIAPQEAESVVNEVSVFLAFDRSALVTPAGDEEARRENLGTIWGRLETGADANAALLALQSEERVFRENASSMYQQSNDETHVQLKVESVSDVRTAWASKRLALLNSGALLVLLIGCTNVANLLLAQSSGRMEEFWVRRMLGADTWRIQRQCFAEVVALMTLGWLLAILVAFYGVSFLQPYSQELFRSGSGIELGWPVWMYSAGLAAFCAIALGTIVGRKAILASQSVDNAKSQQQSTAGKDEVWLRSGLAVAQVALTLVLIISGGLLLKSFYRLTHQDFGFQPNGVVTGRIHLTDTKYKDEVQREAFKRELLDRLNHHPDVESASLSTVIPSFGFPERYVLKHDAGIGESASRCFVGTVSPRHFETLGIALLRGRQFNEDDAFGWKTPVVVDSRFAETVYPGEEVVGKRIALGRRPNNPDNWPVIVGVVEWARNVNLDGSGDLPVVYLPLKGSWANEFSVFVKSRRESGFALQVLSHALGSLDPQLPVYRSGTLESVVNRSLAGRRGLMVLCSGIGVMAVILSVVGVYGASAFRVTQRLREFAIRIAVGARERDVIQNHVGREMRHATIGLGLGLLISWQVGRLLTLWLFQVSAFDWKLYTSCFAGLAAVYLFSCYMPSSRSVRRMELRL